MNTANEQTKNSNNDFQNSNLTNSGSSNFTRDYDKEPIIIKDKIKLLNFMIIALSFIFLFFFMYIFEIRSNIKNWAISGATVGLGYTAIMGFSLKKFIFKNGGIKILDSDKKELYIKIESIKYFVLNCSSAEDYDAKMPISKNLLLASILIVALFVIYFSGLGVFCMLFVSPFLAYFLSRLILYYMQNDSLLEYKLYDGIAIFYEDSDGENFINFIPSISQRIQIRIYFMQRIKKDIENGEKTFILFKDKISRSKIWVEKL